MVFNFIFIFSCSTKEIIYNIERSEINISDLLTIDLHNKIVALVKKFIFIFHRHYTHKTKKY